MEDQGTTYRIFQQCSKVAYRPVPMYYYYQRPDSILHRRNMKFYEDKLDMGYQKYRAIREAYPGMPENDAAMLSVVEHCYPYLMQDTERRAKMEAFLQECDPAAAKLLCTSSQRKYQLLRCSRRLYAKLFLRQNKGGKFVLNDTVSIIVPIYNKEKYLEKCLDSILGQTYRDLEIILVDDGSTDNSLAICQHYAEKDPRIKIYHKPNGGVSSARNLGLEKSTGKYISFVDPDDFIHSEFIERLEMMLVQSDAEIAYCKMLDVWEGSDVEHIPQITDKVCILDARRYDWFAPAAHKVACGAVYRKSCVKDIRFSDDLYIGEDTLFLAECIKKASKIVRSESELYYYYRNDQSVTLCDYFTGKLTEMMAWERIVVLYANESLVQKTAKAGYSQVCRELVVKYGKSARFMEEGYPKAKAGFYRWAKEMMQQQLQEKRYFYWLKTMYSYFFWDAWVKKKQGE